jgi:hypothetical protein
MIEKEPRIEENHVDYVSEDFMNDLPKDEEVCDICGGTGEVDVMGFVWPGEPHMAPIDSRICDCKIDEEDM